MEERKIPVKGSMVRTGVNSLRRSVTINTSARDVEKEDMANPIANSKTIKEIDYGMAPKYLCYNLWDPDSDFTPSTARTREGNLSPGSLMLPKRTGCARCTNFGRLNRQ